jgi:hypothetical protein
MEQMDMISLDKIVDGADLYTFCWATPTKYAGLM